MMRPVQFIRWLRGRVRRILYFFSFKPCTYGAFSKFPSGIPVPNEFVEIFWWDLQHKIIHEWLGVYRLFDPATFEVIVKRPRPSLARDPLVCISTCGWKITSYRWPHLFGHRVHGTKVMIRSLETLRPILKKKFLEAASVSS